MPFPLPPLKVPRPQLRRHPLANWQRCGTVCPKLEAGVVSPQSSAGRESPLEGSSPHRGQGNLGFRLRGAFLPLVGIKAGILNACVRDACESCYFAFRQPLDFVFVEGRTHINVGVWGGICKCWSVSLLCLRCSGLLVTLCPVLCIAVAQRERESCYKRVESFLFLPLPFCFIF